MTAGKRRMAREMAVQMLYQSDLGGSPLSHIFNTFDLSEYLAREATAAAAKKRGKEEAREPADGDDVNGSGNTAETANAVPPADARSDFARQKKRVEDAFLYAQSLVQGTVDGLTKIDELIRSQADNWRLERMPAVDRNILRLAVFEMLHDRETPKLVVVDEAIELAKRFGSEQSGRFVNGLLDGLLKQHTFPGTLK
jgi:N utilization substance protein B